METLILVVGLGVAAFLTYHLYNSLNDYMDSKSEDPILRARQRLKEYGQAKEKKQTKREKEQERAMQIIRDADTGGSILDMISKSERQSFQLKDILIQADIPIRAGTFINLMLMVGALGAVCGFVITGNNPLGLAGGLAGFLPMMAVKVKRNRRSNKFSALFPDALEMLSNALKAGHSLMAGMQLVGDEMPDPVGTEFFRCFEEQKFGLPFSQAVTNMLKRMDNRDLKFFATAILIQQEVGGNMVEMLGKISFTIRERFRLLGQVRALTAQGKMTGIVIGGLPFALAGMFTVMNYKYISVLWTTDAGIAVMIFLLVWQGIGCLIIKNIVSLKV